MKNWQLLSKTKKRTTDEVMNALLKNRGLVSQKEINVFLNPPHPCNLTLKAVGIDEKEVQKAVKRIEKSISDNETVIVYTDYDCDGICAGAVMWETLRSLGARTFPYVPNRIEEGYGLTRKGLKAIADKWGRPLIVTVDHGVTAGDEVEYARDLGMEVIICDHHALPSHLPRVTALIHTTRLSGAGAAWMLAKKIKNEKLKTKNNNNWGLDLAALATIADLVPLVGANRSFVRHGLLQINKAERPGISALIDVCGLKKGGVGVYEAGHMLAPRINAAGRLDSALDSLRLLCTKSLSGCALLAEKLTAINRERQTLTEETYFHARELISDTREKLLFARHESFNQGVIGLVAGKLVDEFYRPAIVISQGKQFSKASARSIAGFNIIEAIREASEFLVDCGGHPLAAGFTIETAKIEILRQKLTAIADLKLNDDKLKRNLKIDCEIAPDLIGWPFWEKLQTLEPFGFGNPQPVFLVKNLKITDMKIVGNSGKHMKLRMAQQISNLKSQISKVFDAIAFNIDDKMKQLKEGDHIEAVFILDKNEWNGRKTLQMKMKDIRKV